MFLAHSIRLRDPWQCESAPDGGRCWSRVFHRPTGLEADDSLVLVISGLPAEAGVSVNGHPFAGCECDVTAILAEANRVEISVPAAAGGTTAATAFPYDARLAIVGRS